MKLRNIIRAIVVIAVGGYGLYRLLKKADIGKFSKTSLANQNREEPSKEDESIMVVDEELNEDNISQHEEKCVDTMQRVHTNMNERNEMANLVLSDIHDGMKKSEDNISKKKADIEKLMENLKK